MKVRQLKARLHRRLRPLTYVAQPFGPGLYFHPGVYVVRFNDQGVRRRFW